MTGLVRKATLFGVCGLLAASAALANVPDPATSTVPKWLYMVGVVGNAADLSLNGRPDMDGATGRPFAPPFAPNDPVPALPAMGQDLNAANVITIRDFSGLPISGVNVTINFPCDLNLCLINYGPVGPFGPLGVWSLTGQDVRCPDVAKGYQTLHGVTDVLGQWKFAIVGAAKNPGNVIAQFPPNPPAMFEGGGYNSTVIKVSGYAGDFALANTIALDQGGSRIIPPVGSNGVTAVDAGIVLNDALGAVAAGGVNGGFNQSFYRPRNDHNKSGNVTPIDAGDQLTHFLRVANIGATQNGFTNCSGQVPATGTFCQDKTGTLCNFNP